MFRTFFMAGFEGATGYNCHGAEIDQVAATHHDRFLDEDFAMISAAGLRTAREAVRWRLVDKGSGYDFTQVDEVLEASRRQGIQIVWDLFHYGYPDDVDLFSDGFVDRFAEYCRAVAVRVAGASDGPRYYTPINEPSYFAWAAGDAAMFAPHCRGRSFELKTWLIKAAIQGIEAIWSVDRQARIVNVDALCRTVAPIDEPHRQIEADEFNEGAVMQSWDMLSGRLCPELGGSPRHLDILGLNYYWTNQWELGMTGVPLHPEDPRCLSLSDLIRWVYDRYGHELIISETSHLEEMRGPWMESLTQEIDKVLSQGIPLRGVCLYPILGMPEWHEPEVWTQMGLWDCRPNGGCLERVRHEPMYAALRRAQALFEPATIRRRWML